MHMVPVLSALICYFSVLNRIGTRTCHWFRIQSEWNKQVSQNSPGPFLTSMYWRSLSSKCFLKKSVPQTMGRIWKCIVFGVNKFIWILGVLRHIIRPLSSLLRHHITIRKRPGEPKSVKNDKKQTSQGEDERGCPGRYSKRTSYSTQLQLHENNNTGTSSTEVTISMRSGSSEQLLEQRLQLEEQQEQELRLRKLKELAPKKSNAKKEKRTCKVRIM